MPRRHISDLVEEVAPSGQPPFAGTTKKTGWAYAIAVVVPFLEVAIRLTFAPVLNDEPFLELFLFPILLSAFLGGLQPGLTATILSALTAAYFLLPPQFSFSLANKTDQSELFSLVVLGTLVSLLFDSTHHNEKRPKQKPNSHHWQAIAWKTQMFCGIGLTSLAIVGIFSFRSILNLRAEAEHLKRAQNAIIQFRQTFFAVSELQLAQRNYVITGDAADLATYFAAVKEVKRQIINLHQQTAQSQEQLKLVEEVEITINQRIDLAQSTIEKRQVEGFPAAQRFIQEGKGARLNEEIQHRLEIIETLARQEMANAETRTRRIGQTTQTVIVGSSILAFCFVAIGSFLLRRDFAGRGRAEAALQEEREHLEVRVAERTGELAQTVATVTQTKALLQTVIENLAEGVIISDLNGSLVLWNEVGLAMHGFENVKEWSYHLPELQNIFELSTLEGNFIESPAENPGIDFGDECRPN
ncbi:MAG: DUF4118 domain-containing protein [Blastocatellia bacterium]|nr:DUF4118 domain-containing protein [Blastocatellia bacterium]